jgi:hypothetical protein
MSGWASIIILPSAVPLPFDSGYASFVLLIAGTAGYARAVLATPESAWTGAAPAAQPVA